MGSAASRNAPPSLIHTRLTSGDERYRGATTRDSRQTPKESRISTLVAPCPERLAQAVFFLRAALFVAGGGGAPVSAPVVVGESTALRLSVVFANLGVEPVDVTPGAVPALIGPLFGVATLTLAGVDAVADAKFGEDDAPPIPIPGAPWRPLPSMCWCAPCWREEGGWREEPGRFVLACCMAGED